MGQEILGGCKKGIRGWDGVLAHRQVFTGDKAPLLGTAVLEEALQLCSCLGGPGLWLWSHRGILAISGLSCLPPAAGAQFPAFSGHSLSNLHAALV